MLGQRILSGSQLHEDIEFQHYWQSLSSVPAIPIRGYQLVQSLEKKNIDNLRIDTDTTQNDELGDSMVWLTFSSDSI